MKKTDEAENNPKKGKRNEEEEEEEGSAMINYDQHQENFNMRPFSSHQSEGGSESTRNDIQVEVPLGESRLHRYCSVEGMDESNTHSCNSNYKEAQGGTVEVLPNEPLHVVDMNCDDVHSIVNYLISVEREEFKEKCPAQSGSDDDKYDDTRDDTCDDSYDEAHDSAEDDGGRTHSSTDTPAVSDPPNVSPQRSLTDHMDKYDIKYRHIFNSMVDYIFSHPSVNFLELMNKREGDEGGNSTWGRRRWGSSLLGMRRPIKWYNNWTYVGPSNRYDSVVKHMKWTRHTPISDEESSKGCELSLQKGQSSGEHLPSDITGRHFKRESVDSEATSHCVNAWWRYNLQQNDHPKVRDQTEKAKSGERENSQMDNTHKVDTIRARIETLHKGIFSSLNKLRNNHNGCTSGEDPQEENRKGEDIPTVANRSRRNSIFTDFNIVGRLPLCNSPTDWKSGEVYVHAPCERKKSIIRSVNRIMRALLPEGRKTILSCVNTDEDIYVWCHVRFADFTQVGPSYLELPPSGQTSNYYSSLLHTGKKNSRCKMDQDDKIEQMEKVQFYFQIREFTRQQYKMNMLGEYLQVKELTESIRHLGGDSPGEGSYNNAHFTRREVHIKRFELLYQYYLQFLRRFYLEGDTSTEEATLIRLKCNMYGLDRCSSDCVDQQQGGDPSPLGVSQVETTEVTSSREESSHMIPSPHDRPVDLVDLSRKVGSSLPGCPSSHSSDTAHQDNPKVGPHPRASANEISETRKMRILHRCAKRIRRFLRRTKMDEPEKLPLRKMRKIVKSLCAVCAVRYRSFLSHELFSFVFKSAWRRKRVKRETQLDRTEREELPHQANLPLPTTQRRPVKIILKRNIKSCRDPQLEKHFKLDDSPERSGRNGGVVKHSVEEVAREDPPNGSVMDHPVDSTTAPPSEVSPHRNVLIEEAKKPNVIKKKLIEVGTKKTREKCTKDVKGSDKGKKKRTRSGKTQNDEDVAKKRKRGKSPHGKYLPTDGVKTEQGDQRRKEIKTSAYRSKYSRRHTSPSDEQPKRSRLGCKTHRKEAQQRGIYYVYLKGNLGVYLSPQMEVIYERRNLFFKGDDRKGNPLDMHFDEVFSHAFFSKILPTCVDKICVRKVSTGSPQRGGDSDGRGRSGSIHSRNSSKSSNSSYNRGSDDRCSGDRCSGQGRRRKNFRDHATIWKGTTSSIHKLKRDQVVALFQILYQHFYKCFSRLNVRSLLGTYCSGCSVNDKGGDESREVDKMDEAGEPPKAQNEYYYHTFLSRFPPLRGKKTVAYPPQDFFKCFNRKFIRRVIYHVNKTLGDFSFMQKLFDEYEHVERVCAGKMAKVFLDCSDYEVTFHEEDRYYNVIKDHFMKVIIPFCEENSA
ncbi:Ser/Thr kinase [Plasmodium coatneyi]|uniref:Ser/Thr kinase n=1 Tax=Plasmodium coatneyi TaxID=208452 RepID=A0A1B1DUU9_9APIC|nr:Ser/Thr kinase [Plasmodium coatneyi]ANQ06397.1 Ser/Thr kinase [Plasmodium coatneyi]